MQKVRSCYGTFGIVYEATYAVRPIVPMAVRHETFSLKDFLERLPELKTSGESLMYYMFPFEDLITVEFRHYNPGATGDPDRHIWPLRNYLWATAGPLFCAQVEANIDDRDVRYKVIDGFCAMWRFKLENLIRSDNTVATDQIIQLSQGLRRQPVHLQPVGLPGRDLPDGAAAVLRVLQEIRRGEAVPQQHALRGIPDCEGPAIAALLFVGRQRDDHRPGLHRESRMEDLPAGLQPVLQRPRRTFRCPIRRRMVTRAQVEKALGDRWKQFADARKTFDPGNRLLNDYFRELLGVA